MQKPVIVELFAGIGCVAQAFYQNGFEPLLLTDIDAQARDAFRENFSDIKYIQRDVAELRPGQVLEAVEGREITGLLGCPPCQGFSAAGVRNPIDERNRLVRHYFRLVKSLRPSFIVMENVPRVFQYELFLKLLTEVAKDYMLWAGVMNAALFGVPQTRQRAVVIGYRRSLGVIPTPPKPTHLGRRGIYDYVKRKIVQPTTPEMARVLGLYPELARPGDFWSIALKAIAQKARTTSDIVRVGDAISDLPPASDREEPLPSSKGSIDENVSRPHTTEIHNHVRWNHTRELLEVIREVPEGHGLLDNYGRGSARPYFSQAYSRLHRRGLARTITTNFHNAGSGRFLHYREHRTLTVREAARLQGIPDTFRFVGPRSVQERLVGNAFPIPLAAAIARHIRSQLRSLLKRK